MTHRLFLLSTVAAALLAGTCHAQANGPGGSPEFATHMQKAQALLREKRPELAIPELEKAVSLDARSVEAQGNLGVLLFFQGKQAEAIPHLRAAVELQPSLAKIQGVLGLAELQQGDAEQARKDLETALPAVDEVKFKVQVGLALVTLYTQKGDLEAAPAVLAQLRRAAPDNPEVLYASYRTYSDLSGEAMLSLSLGAPDSAQMHQVLAHEEMKEGNTNGAIAQFKQAIAIDPRLPGIHFELAELLRTSPDPGAKREAEQEYRKAVAANVRDEKSTLRLADIDAGNGSTARALDEYKRAVELQPGDAEAKLALAKVLLESNEDEKALALLQSAVQLEPSNAVAHFRLGTLYRKMGRVEDAKREVEIYKKLKDAKEKMRAVYKDLLVQPQQIRVEQAEEK